VYNNQHSLDTQYCTALLGPSCIATQIYEVNSYSTFNSKSCTVSYPWNCRRCTWRQLLALYKSPLFHEL